MSNVILDNVTYNQPVADTTALNAIPTGSLVAGVQCFVNSTHSIYYWSGSAWVQESGGGANPLGTYLVQTATAAPANAQVMSSLATGLVKNTTSTGVQSIGVDGTDYYGPATTTILQSIPDATLYIGSGGPSLATDGSANVFVGVGSGTTITTGLNNVFIGANVAPNITTESNNVGIGGSVFSSAVGISDCIGIGTFALNDSTAGIINSIGIGSASLQSDPSGNNVGIGGQTFASMTAGAGYNTAVGTLAASTFVEYDNCTFVGGSCDATVSALSNAGAFGYQATVSVSSAINLGNGCFIGINKPSPLAALHVANVSSTANIAIDSTSVAPGTITGAGQIYVSNPDLIYVPPGSAIYYPLDKGLIAAEVTNIPYTDIAAGPVTILPANGVNDVVVKKVLFYVPIAILGGVDPIVLQGATGPSDIFSVPNASLTTGSIFDQASTVATIGAAYYVPLTNNVIQIAQNSSLTAGTLTVLIEYQLQ